MTNNEKIKNKESINLKKLIETQSRIINKVLSHDIIREYIKGDVQIAKIVESLEFCSYKVHKDALKDFITKYKFNIDQIKEHEYEAVAINGYKFTSVTEKVFNRKLEELEYLKLIQFDDCNENIVATDLLRTIRNRSYKRRNKSVPDGSKFSMLTEDKLLAYQYYLSNDYLRENEELISKFSIYNNIYFIDKNIFVLGRKPSEELTDVKKRLEKVLKSKLIDKDVKLNDKGEVYYIPIIIYISKNMKIGLEDLEDIQEKMLNTIEIIRY